MPVARIMIPRSVWSRVFGKATRPTETGKKVLSLLARTKTTKPQEGGIVLWEPGKELCEALITMLDTDVRYSKNKESAGNLTLLATLNKLKEYQNATQSS